MRERTNSSRLILYVLPVTATHTVLFVVVVSHAGCVAWSIVFEKRSRFSTHYVGAVGVVRPTVLLLFSRGWNGARRRVSSSRGVGGCRERVLLERREATGVSLSRGVGGGR